eukprot:6203038-Pleurochrysis_carterae.AAC.1
MVQSLVNAGADVNASDRRRALASWHLHDIAAAAHTIAQRLCYICSTAMLHLLTAHNALHQVIRASFLIQWTCYICLRLLSLNRPFELSSIVYAHHSITQFKSEIKLLKLC